MTKHTEATFETALEISLTKEGGYKKRAPSKFDEALALFPDDVTGLEDRQLLAASPESKPASC